MKGKGLIFPIPTLDRPINWAISVTFEVGSRKIVPFLIFLRYKIYLSNN